jgi:hypothetical protein
MKYAGIFCGHLVYFTPIWYIFDHLVHFKDIWYIFYRCGMKNLATLQHGGCSQ